MKRLLRTWSAARRRPRARRPSSWQRHHRPARLVALAVARAPRCCSGSCVRCSSATRCGWRSSPRRLPARPRRASTPARAGRCPPPTSLEAPAQARPGALVAAARPAWVNTRRLFARRCHRGRADARRGDAAADGQLCRRAALRRRVLNELPHAVARGPCSSSAPTRRPRSCGNRAAGAYYSEDAMKRRPMLFASAAVVGLWSSLDRDARPSPAIQWWQPTSRRRAAPPPSRCAAPGRHDRHPPRQRRPRAARPLAVDGGGTPSRAESGTGRRPPPLPPPPPAPPPLHRRLRRRPADAALSLRRPARRGAAGSNKPRLPRARRKAAGGRRRRPARGRLPARGDLAQEPVFQHVQNNVTLAQARRGGRTPDDTASHPAPYALAALAALTSALWLAGCAAQQHNGDGLVWRCCAGKTAEGPGEPAHRPTWNAEQRGYRIDHRRPARSAGLRQCCRAPTGTAQPGSTIARGYQEVLRFSEGSGASSAACAGAEQRKADAGAGAGRVNIARAGRPRPRTTCAAR